MQDRIKNFDRDVRDSFNKKGLSSKTGYVEFGKRFARTEQLANSYFNLIGIGDMAVALPTWYAAYQKALDGNVEGAEVNNEQQAIAYADQTVRITQGSGEIKDLSGVQRGSDTQKLFTMFYSYFSVLYNQFSRTNGEFRSEKDFTNFINSLFLLWLAPAVLEQVLLDRGPDEDADEAERRHHYLMTLGGYPLNGVIGVRDLVNGAGEFGYNPSPAFDGFRFGSRTIRAATQTAVGADEWSDKDTKAAFMSLSYATGIPGRQMLVTGSFFYDWMNGDIDSKGIEETARDALLKRKK